MKDIIRIVVLAAIGINLARLALMPLFASLDSITQTLAR